MKKTLIGLIAALVIVGGGAAVFFMGKKDATSTKTTTSTQPSTTTNSTGTEQTTPSVTVAIQDFAFSPATLKVKKGSTVTWTNKDSAPHTVTATGTSGGPSSKTLQNGDSYSFTFDQVGTFAYHCSFHSSMTATVEVTE